MERLPTLAELLVGHLALADGVHSLSMEGLRPTEKGIEVAMASARGTLTLEEAEAALDEHYGLSIEGR